LIDALAYVDQMAIVPYASDLELEDDYIPMDAVAGY
jgi:hypothetical protein